MSLPFRLVKIRLSKHGLTGVVGHRFAESGDDDAVFFVGETLPRVVYALLRRR